MADVAVHFKVHKAQLQTRDERIRPYEPEAETQSLSVNDSCKQGYPVILNLNQKIAPHI